MLRAITVSENKVNYRMSMVPANKLHVSVKEPASLAYDAGVSYEVARYNIGSRWTCQSLMYF